jgi:hypothetical protein
VTAEALPRGLSFRWGALRFMAPELFDDDGLQPSPACDVYSFAVLLAELWTGTAAWKNVLPHVAAARVVLGRRPFSPRDLLAKAVPPSIIALIVACWAQNPHERPTFDQLGTLRDVPNFHLAPPEMWPPFLRTTSPLCCELRESRDVPEENPL